MKIYTFLYATLFFCAGFCCPEEDYLIGKDYTVTLEDAISIRPDTSSFSPGDTLWVKTVIPLSVETNEIGNLTLSEFLAENLESYISFALFVDLGFSKDTQVELTEEDIIQNIGNSYFQYPITSILEETEEGFISEFGIILPNEGNYYLTNFPVDTSPTIYFYNNNTGDSVAITSSISNTDADNRFYFSIGQ